jgi:hypothetical protein
LLWHEASLKGSELMKLTLARPSCQTGLNHLPVVEKSTSCLPSTAVVSPRADVVFLPRRSRFPAVTTPTGLEYNGVGFEGKICGVSIMRCVVSPSPYGSPHLIAPSSI